MQIWTTLIVCAGLALASVGCSEAEETTHVKKQTPAIGDETTPTTPGTGNNAPGNPGTPTSPAPAGNDPMQAACTSFCEQVGGCLTTIGCGQIAGTPAQCVGDCMTRYTAAQASQLVNITCDSVNTQMCNGAQAAQVREQCQCDAYMDQGQCIEGLTCYAIDNASVCLDLANGTGVPADAATCAGPNDCGEGQICITLQDGGSFCVTQC